MVSLEGRVANQILELVFYNILKKSHIPAPNTKEAFLTYDGDLIVLRLSKLYTTALNKIFIVLVRKYVLYPKIREMPKKKKKIKKLNQSHTTLKFNLMVLSM